MVRMLRMYHSSLIVRSLSFNTINMIQRLRADPSIQHYFKSFHKTCTSAALRNESVQLSYEQWRKGCKTLPLPQPHANKENGLRCKVHLASQRLWGRDLENHGITPMEARDLTWLLETISNLTNPSKTYPRHIQQT